MLMQPPPHLQTNNLNHRLPWAAMVNSEFMQVYSLRTSRLRDRKSLFQHLFRPIKPQPLIMIGEAWQ